jgi:hypothetical protein
MRSSPSGPWANGAAMNIGVSDSPALVTMPPCPTGPLLCRAGRALMA